MNHSWGSEKGVPARERTALSTKGSRRAPFGALDRSAMVRIGVQRQYRLSDEKGCASARVLDVQSSEAMLRACMAAQFASIFFFGRGSIPLSGPGGGGVPSRRRRHPRLRKHAHKGFVKPLQFRFDSVNGSDIGSASVVCADGSDGIEPVKGALRHEVGGDGLRSCFPCGEVG